MGNGMRVLKVITITMGVLIVGGTGLLVAVIAHRASSPSTTASIALTLDEPAGAHIAGVTVTQDRLAVQLQGGGADRVVLIDLRSGAIVGRITLAR